MYDYLFFDKNLKNTFITKLKQLNTDFVETVDHGNDCIQISEDIDEQIIDQIDDLYDELLDKQAAITIEEEPDSINLVGIQFTGNDNVVSQARLEPDLVNKLHQTFSFIEIQELVQTIASAALNPDVSPLCKKEK